MYSTNLMSKELTIEYQLRQFSFLYNSQFSHQMDVDIYVQNKTLETSYNY